MEYHSRSCVIGNYGPYFHLCKQIMTISRSSRIMILIMLTKMKNLILSLLWEAQLRVNLSMEALKSILMAQIALRLMEVQLSHIYGSLKVEIHQCQQMPLQDM